MTMLFIEEWKKVKPTGDEYDFLRGNGHIITLDDPREGFQFAVESLTSRMHYRDPLPAVKMLIVKYEDDLDLPFIGRVNLDRQPDLYWTPDGWSREPFNWLGIAMKTARSQAWTHADLKGATV